MVSTTSPARNYVHHAPLTATLAEFAGTREPNGVVGHFDRGFTA